MTKKLLLAMSTAALLAAGPAAAYTVLGATPGGATVLDFDVVSAHPSVTFTTVNGTGAPTIESNEIGGGLGINGGPADPAIYTAIAQDAPLRVTFAGGASAAGGFYIDGVPLIGRGFFFDVDGALIATFLLDAEVDFWALQADPGDKMIGSILFDSTGYPGSGFGADVSESYTVDNLFFVAAVPAPSVLSLLGLGLLGAGIGRLRRRT